MSNPASFVTAAFIDSGNVFTGDQTITGDLTITGDVTINGNLTHTGGATFSEVRAATTANITLSGAQTIDDVRVVAGNRVLVKNQNTGSQNGIYVAAASAWSRADDLPAFASAAGLLVIVQEGTANADVTFICTNDVGSDVVGTNNLTFASGAVVDSLLVHKAGKLNPVHIAHASQAIGDLLVADSPTTMTRLADVAVGQVLKSGGVGAAPSYGVIGGTTAAGSAHTHTFTGDAPTTATAEAFTGTGFATAGQVVTTTDNQTMTLNQCAGMWLITASQAPCLIESNTAVTGAQAVLTVYGLAPTTNAETYKILRAPTPAGSNANESTHTHSGTGLT